MTEAARTPNELERLFVERALAGDLDGLLALYESGAVVTDGAGNVAHGKQAIRSLLSTFLSQRPVSSPHRQAEALSVGDLALTSSRFTNGTVSAEVARRQPDGRWLWVLDHFAINQGGE